MPHSKSRIKPAKVLNKKLLKKKIIKSLEELYVSNPAMRADIDSYNYGIYDAAKKIKEIL